MQDNESETDDSPARGENTSGVESTPATALPLPSAPVAPSDQRQQYNVYNIQQIPSRAFDSLTPEHVVQIMESMINAYNASDQRQFEFAMDRAKRTDSTSKLALIVGTVLGLAGFGSAYGLAIESYSDLAHALVGSLAAILAVVVGRKLL